MLSGALVAIWRWFGKRTIRSSTQRRRPGTGRTLPNPEQATGDLINHLMLGSLNQGSGKPKPTDYVPSVVAPFAYSAF